MFLYLVQHAEAMSKEEDPSHSLSEKGIADIRAVAEFVKGLNINLHQILHSGKTRALQTAQILEEHMTVYTGIVEADGLAPMDEPDIWFKCLAKMNENVMIVGHLPHLAGLAALLLCGDKGKNIVNFEMGNIVCLKRADNYTWSVDWVIKPGVLK